MIKRKNRINGKFSLKTAMFGFVITAFLCTFFGLIFFVTQIKAEDVKIILDRYEVEKGDFSPGSVATVSFYLKNMSAKTTAKNVIVNFSGDNSVTPVYGESNQKYLESIAPGQTVCVSYKMDIPSDIEAAKVILSLNVTYALGEGGGQNAVDAYIPVQYESSLEVNSVSVAETVKLGTKALVSITYANKSENAVKDVTFHFDGNINNDGKEVNIGNVEAGASLYKDMYVTFLDLGEQTIDITMSYSDLDGKKYTKDVSSEMVTVVANSTPNPEAYSQEAVEQKQREVQIKMIEKAVVVVAILGVIITIIRMLRKKKD